MALGQDLLNTPPPSPVTTPTAAAESNPGAKLSMLTQGMGPMAGMQQDLSGILGLGQKLSEGLLTLQQALPAAAGQLEQARSLIEGALAQYLGQQADAPGAPQSPPVGTVTQTGPQYPGGGFGSGKPF